MAWNGVFLVVVALWCRAGPVTGASSGVTICSCDLSPGNCDLTCCCDPDCSLTDPAIVFTSCVPGSTRAERWACLYNWLIFRNNTPYTTTLLGSPPTQLFCVLVDDASLNYFVTPRMVNASNFAPVSEPYKGRSFSTASQSVPEFSSFYKAGDPILTLSASNTVSVLRQPAPVGAQNICSDRNPAKFLMGSSTLCLRMFSNLTASCETDPSLDPSYYYRDIEVLRVPADVSAQGSRTIPITSSVTDGPLLVGDQCNNVVSQVVYSVLYNGSRGISRVSVSFVLSNVSTTSPSMQQNITFIYKPISSAAGSSGQTRSGNPGYLVGYPVLSSNGPLLLLRSLVAESCSYAPVQFGINAFSGCAIRGTAQETCSQFQARAYQTLLGGDAAESLAVYGNVTATQSQLWTQIIHQNCSAQGSCSSGCLVPVFLDMQILWAQVGLISNPQAQLLGARFLYTCQSVKCQDTTLLQSRVTFTDLTRRGPAPRASPGVTSRDPADFFFPFQRNAAVPALRSPFMYVVLCCWRILRHV